MIDLELRKDIFGWDIFNWSKSLDFFDKHINYENIKNVLELGADDQSSGYSLFFADKGYPTICSSYEKTNKKLIKRHKKFSSAKRITYEVQDARKISYKNQFEIICFKSMLGGICKRKNFNNATLVFNQIYEALKPGGYLVFSENIKATFIHNYFRRKYSSKSWYYFEQRELVNLMSSNFNYINSETNGFLACFGRNEDQKRLIGEIDERIFKQLVPTSWNYIFFGVCQKPIK